MPKLVSDLEKQRNRKPILISKKLLHDYSFDTSPVNIVHPGNGTIMNGRSFQGLISKLPTTRFVLVVKPNVKYNTQLFSALDHAMRRFASSPATLAWEKVPFSFVVDWLVDVRGVLSKVDKAIGFTPYEIISFTKSHSYALETQQFWHLQDATTAEVLHDERAVTRRYKHYERSLVSESASPIWKPRVGKSQLGIAAALLIQALTRL
jgi:hypothetical protein